MGGWLGRVWFSVWFFGGLRWVVRGLRDYGFAEFGGESDSNIRIMVSEAELVVWILFSFVAEGVARVEPERGLKAARTRLLIVTTRLDDEG